jgi:hypothetical protein
MLKKTNYIPLFPQLCPSYSFSNSKLQKLYKNTSHQQMHKESFMINRNTLLHVSNQQGRNM